MKIKKLWRYFIVIFLIVFLIINWNEVSWIFNYRMVSGFLSEFFKTSDNEIQKIDSFNDSHNSGDNKYYQKEDSIEIPKIEVDVPLIFVDSSEEKKIVAGLDLGVVHFPSSVLPGQVGQTIILGHSAPAHWPKVKYYHVFVRLNELVEGDEIYLYFEHKKYQYIVSGKFFLEKGEKIPQGLTNNKNVLYLVSCWPPETGIKRIAVEAQQKI